MLLFSSYCRTDTRRLKVLHGQSPVDKNPSDPLLALLDGLPHHAHPLDIHVLLCISIRYCNVLKGHYMRGWERHGHTQRKVAEKALEVPLRESNGSTCPHGGTILLIVLDIDKRRRALYGEIIIVTRLIKEEIMSRERRERERRIGNSTGAWWQSRRLSRVDRRRVVNCRLARQEDPLHIFKPIAYRVYIAWRE